MEVVIGLSASLVTFAELTQRIISFASRIRHSTNDFQRFKSLVRDIEDQIQLLQSKRESMEREQERLHLGDRENVPGQIAKAEEHLKDILSDVQLPTTDSKWKIRRMWVLKLNEKALKAWKSISRVQATLNNTLKMAIYEMLARQKLSTDIHFDNSQISSVGEAIQIRQFDAIQENPVFIGTNSQILP
jgi:chromosome segregation ATPase